jgi:filamentous hemagglutinin
MVGHGLLIAGKVLANGAPMTKLYANMKSSSDSPPTKSDIASRIANGHSFDKLVITQNEFKELGVNTRERFAGFIDNIMNNASGSDLRTLSNGRVAYWDNSTNMVVIYDPNSSDWGTAFRPTDGRIYFDGLK